MRRKTLRKLPSATREFARRIDEIETNVRWLRKHLSTLSSLEHDSRALKFAKGEKNDLQETFLAPKISPENGSNFHA